MANQNLHKAKEAKNDEFYTQLTDVAEELRHYKEHFKDKVVFCNCDDPAWSAFWKYFHLNFAHLGLKKLISTHYDKEKPTYKMVYEGGNDNDVEAGVITPLEGNGDFRNQECIDLLEETDIVVTNPPFSIARESYLPQLFEHDKKFLIIGDLNWVTYKLIFPLLKENKMWMGYSNVKEFLQPDGSIKKFGNKLWFTNLDIKKRHEKLILWKKYTPEEFPRYDNYDAINVDKVSNIPCDYCESWRVTEEEFKNFAADEWEITREEKKDGEKSFFIIPAAGTELRKMLHEHSAGYREEIEKSIWKNMQKNIIYADNDTSARQETCKTGNLQDRKPARQVLPRSARSSDYIPRQIQSGAIQNCRKRVFTCSRQRPRIRAWKANVQQNLCAANTVTVLSECQSRSLASTVQNSSVPSDMSTTRMETEAREFPVDNLRQEEKENTNESSSEKYCNGVIGVPITFLDKYSPEQFEIVNANDFRTSENVPVKQHGLIKDKDASITVTEGQKENTKNIDKNSCKNIIAKSRAEQSRAEQSRGGLYTPESASARNSELLAPGSDGWHIAGKRKYARIFIRKIL